MTFSIILFIGLASFGYPPLRLLHPLDGVQNSQIQGNVPKQFHKILKRELTTYFQEMYKEAVTVEYELLRDVPTQVGVALPKYYIWVKIYSQKVLLDEGAVKVAAVERKLFTVSDYLAIADLKKSSEKINQVFPLALGDKIRARLK
ncbi:MAG: hypothetical protein DCF19_19925 [Pseudanabaena frigida]|uniref:Uncharacterized protein n=1 Tax=Pseudanabaena frigida TaxID=945775 RepID=A0A2W4W0E5_9CYAN|nr:MAG: hypothetical protein DCF19_19925 [Pseudanabaena frigida]